MIQPKPIPRKYEELARNVDSGIYQIPKFQRDFVWPKEQTAKLLDSIIKSYPIGTFILWKTRERLKSVKKLGGKILKPIPEGDYVYYILDGQQRIASLYLAIEGIKLDGNNDYKEIFINLSEAKKWLHNPEYNGEFITASYPEDESLVITFYELINERTSKLARKFDHLTDRDEVEDLIDDLKESVKGYEFPTIEIEKQPLSRIAEVFTRINTGGKVLTLFEIMNAKVYQEEKDENGNHYVAFDLEEKFNELIENLKNANFETIAENKTIILQLISLILKQNAKREAILSLPKKDFINKWNDAVKSLQPAVDKIRTYFMIPVSRILPYYVLIVPIAYFYYINDFKDPTPSQLEDLKIYFFRSAFSNRFSSAVESKLNSDIKLMEKIKREETIGWEKEIPLPSIDKEYFKERLKESFTTSNAFHKGVLCMLAYFQPKRFNDDSLVLLDNSWLSISTSKNYHHFFPKSFLKKIGKEECANAIANITFVDDYLNKRVIKAKPPSEYILKDFKRQNPNIEETVKSHLIDDIDTYGIPNDDYEVFLEKRSEKIAEEILKRIG